MFKIIGIVLAFVFLLFADGATRTATAMQSPLNVVSSFSVIGHFVEKVGGDRVANRILVGADSDSHTYDPSPQDVAALRSAQLVVQNGLGFEPWMDRIYASSRSNAARVSVAETLGSLRMVGHEDHGDEHEDEEDADEVDPHVWHDVRNAVQMVGTIRDVLILTDPANGATYVANAEAYVTELNTLDAWVMDQVGRVPSANRKLVTSHDTFGYFAQRYGFTIIGSALGVTTEVADPSAGQIAQLVSEIKAAQVPAIFAENVSNPRLMDQIASAAGVKLVPDLYTDALGALGTEGSSYVAMMRHNVGRIVAALAGG